MGEVNIKPITTIEIHLGIEANGPVQQELTNLVYKYMYRYIPYSGPGKGGIHLRENADITEDAITYKMPYAKYQYYGMAEDGSRKVANYTTPGTGPYWDKLMLSVHAQDIIKEISKKYGGK